MFRYEENTMSHSSPTHRKGPDLKKFLEKFPVIELPFSLTDEHKLEFSQFNDPLTLDELEAYILPHENEHDEFTEYVACIRYPDTKDFHALVYWKAGLLKHEYILASYTLDGRLIDRKPLSGLRSQSDIIVQSVATLETDWMIHIVEGEGSADLHSYEALESRLIQLELLADGRILVI